MNLKVRNMLSVCAILVLGFSAVVSQFEESPCPGVFEYKRDGSGIFGLIHLRSNGPIPSLRVVANFTIAARLPNDYQGRLVPIGNSPDLLQDVNRGAPLDYRVDFPITWPLPRLSGITINSYGLCYGPGDIPGPNQYLTPISLEHTLTLRGIAGSDSFNRNEPQNPTGYSPNSGQTFSVGGNQQNSWNSNYPYNMANNTPPVYQLPTPQPDIPYPEATQPAATPPQEFSEFTHKYESSSSTPAPRPMPLPSPLLINNPQTGSNDTDTVECGIVSDANERRPIIHNGQSYERGDWPWLVAIYKKKSEGMIFACAGTLVSLRHVISAAHCIRLRNGMSPIKDFVVKIGVHNLYDWADDITVTRTIAKAAIHDSYNATSLTNDLVLLTLEKSVEFSPYIRPACLWKEEKADLSLIVGATGVVASWGLRGNTPAEYGEPRLARLEVVSTETCRASRQIFRRLTSEYTLCAGDRNGEGPCVGDSGTGLCLLEGGRWRLRGIVSLALRADTGQKNCNLDEYVVYTDTAKYLNWIHRELRAS